MVGAMVSRGLDVPTCLVAVDGRVFEWRHFLPTSRRLERYAALSVCARKDGLVLSCTRLVHFGPLPEDLGYRVEAVCRIDAELIAATKPGATAGQLFEVADALMLRSVFRTSGETTIRVASQGTRDGSGSPRRRVRRSSRLASLSPGTPHFPVLSPRTPYWLGPPTTKS